MLWSSNDVTQQGSRPKTKLEHQGKQVMPKNILAICLSVVSLLTSGYATAEADYCRIANAVFVGLLPSLEQVNPDYQFGKLICEAGGGNALSCSSSMSVGAGICYADGGNALSCSNSMSLGAGICYAGGGNALSCSNSMSVGAGICYAGGGNALSCSNSMSLGAGICYAGGGNALSCSSSMQLVEGICSAAGVSGCRGITLEQALCKVAGLTECTRISFSQLLYASVKSCGVKVLYIND